MHPPCWKCGAPSTTTALIPEFLPPTNSLYLSHLLKINDPPADSEIPVITSIVSAGQKHINMLDAQIDASSLQASLSRLVEERTKKSNWFDGIPLSCLLSTVFRRSCSLLSQCHRWSTLRITFYISGPVLDLLHPVKGRLSSLYTLKFDTLHWADVPPFFGWNIFSAAPRLREILLTDKFCSLPVNCLSALGSACSILGCLRRPFTHRFARSVLASIVGAVLAVISSAASAAAHSAHLQFSRLVNDPPSPVYAVLAVFCLLPLVDLCAPAAWKRLERAGLVSPLATMATAVHISSSQVAAAAEQDMLIFPTKNGDTEERTFTGKTQEQLKGMCRDYNLTVSGNKTQLKARLQEFSERFCNDPASCNLAPVKRRSHKGPRDGPKKTQPKQSAKRRETIIDTERITERSKDTRTTDQIKTCYSGGKTSLQTMEICNPVGPRGSRGVFTGQSLFFPLEKH
ncbi:hypothetical protein C8R44DRAFT_749175 [Mycena epipterygia]|nr:hypothetical protein C8R44DRAFT_749175 [Mycena epipterygia]